MEKFYVCLISMKIAVIMPCPWMHFSPRQATSSELTVHDILIRLPNNHSSVVYAQKIDDPYTDVPCIFFPRNTKNDNRLLAERIAQSISTDKINMIIVEQHLPTAVKINRFLPSLPILLHRHNNYDPPHKNIIRRWIQSRRFKSIAGIAFVSEYSRQHFIKNWGAIVSCPTFVIFNGMDLSGWAPCPPSDRSSEILFVGRSIPEKGGLELAYALQQILPRYPNWRARFIIGDPDTNPPYRQELLSALDKVKNQTTIAFQRPWTEIQYAYEHADIAVVPSIWEEPFGRTALESMAGGAALISSTRGGLNEVVANAAYRLDTITPDSIATALIDLIEHPEKRKNLSELGQVQAQKFTMEAQVQSFIKACQAVLPKNL